jgi:membrane-associated HD superfamily phosphohydrolase
MDEELTQEDVLSGVDNSSDSTTIDGSSEDTGRDLSQSDDNISSLEIPANFRQQYSIPDNYKTMADVFKGFKGQNELRGQHSNEVGEVRKQNEMLQSQVQQLMQRFSTIQNGIGAKTPEQQQAEFLELLTKDPRQGIQQSALEAIRPELQPIVDTLRGIQEWQQKTAISNDKNEFLRKNNLTADDENALSEIIAADDRGFFRSLPTTQDQLEAAYARLILKKQGEAAKDTVNKQVENVAKQRKAQVLSNTHSRPANGTGSKTLEEMREELMASIPRV